MSYMSSRQTNVDRMVPKGQIWVGRPPPTPAKRVTDELAFFRKSIRDLQEQIESLEQKVSDQRYVTKVFNNYLQEVGTETKKTLEVANTLIVEAKIQIKELEALRRSAESEGGRKRQRTAVIELEDEDEEGCDTVSDKGLACSQMSQREEED